MNQSRLSWFTKAAPPALAAALALNFAARISSVAAHHQLSDVGTRVMFRLLVFGKLTLDGPGRFVSALPQLPSLAGRALGLSPALILRFYETLLAWHPVFSLAACFAILRARKRLDLVVYPVLSFAIADQLTQAWACGGIHDAISLFWPVFLLILTAEKPKNRDLIPVFPFLVALTFTHECAAFFLLLIAACAFQLSRKSRAGHSYYSNIGRYSCLGAIACFVRLPLNPSGSPQSFFWVSSQPLPAIAVLVFLLIGAALWRARGPKPRDEDKRLAVLITLAALAPLLYFATRAVPSIWAERDSRAFSVGLGLGFGVMAFFHRPRHDVRWMMLAAASFLAVGSIHDFKITADWARGVSFISETMQDSPGCKVLAVNDVPRLYEIGIVDLSLPRISYLLQQNRQPRSVLLPPRLAAPDPCLEVAEGGMIDPRRLEDLIFRSRPRATGRQLSWGQR
jgi:hypothetical protein